MLALGVQDSTGNTAVDFPFLSPIFTPTVTFAELALLCAHLLTVEGCDPVRRLVVSADRIINSAHSTWASTLVRAQSAILLQGLSVELGIQQQKSTLALHSVPGASTSITDRIKDSSPSASARSVMRSSFKAQWTSASIEMLDPETDATVQERLLVPSHTSASLLDFLFNVNHRLCACVVSMDTVQQLPPSMHASSLTDITDDRESTGGNDPSVNCLLGFSSATVQLNILQSIVKIYKGLQDSVSSALSGDTLEDVSLQIVFDLLVCQRLAESLDRSKLLSVAHNDHCSQLRAQLVAQVSSWRENIDPVNAELMLPVLTSAASTFADKVGMLAPARLSVGDAEDHASDSNGGVTGNNKMLFSSMPSKPALGVQTTMLGSFISSQPPRFALLPLAVSTTAILSSSNPKSKSFVPFSPSSASKGGKDKAGFGRSSTAGSASRGTTSSTGPSKLGGAGDLTGLGPEAAASANAVGNFSVASGSGSIRRGIMSSLGNLLGGGTSSGDR